MFKRIKYKHEKRFHNVNAANVIVPILMEMFDPTSVVDIGCGIGTFLKVFSQYNVKMVLGLDGKWVNRQMLLQNINESEFMEIDLEKFEPLPKKYDLALCLEVAEHLSSDSADSFISSLTKCSDIIIFSAAVPDQGGQNHLNEQWPPYWKFLFEKNGYLMYDAIRSKIWADPTVDFWYKQNMFVFIKSSIADKINIDGKNPENMMLHIIHPDVFQYKSKRLERILEGRYTLKGYAKMGLKYISHLFTH